ncbi:hypothetical protein [Pseudonocardia sp. NPDC049154]|uniref:hypothetical protein n=1 Tax=Pseudonocardia sp. NPDC049154 TaxID=3155501 RepID=UPI0033C6F1F2
MSDGRNGHGRVPARIRPDFDVPVLLIMFNRPDKVRRMVQLLRVVRPQRLLVAADGPRANVPDDTIRCAEARRAIDDVDWPCDIEVLFQDANLGCKRGPETAISWFFSRVSEGLILEDDCLPSADFFPFCAELLERYRHEEQVMMISGFNAVGSWKGTDKSYVSSRTSPTWGWATWARAWAAYDPAMSAWSTPEGRRAVRRRLPFVEYLLLRRRFDSVVAGDLRAWDFAWAFAMLYRGGLSLVSVRNVVTNVGFGVDATHTWNPWCVEARVPILPIRFPLVHVDRVELSPAFERAAYRTRWPWTRRIMTLLPSRVAERIRALTYAGVSRGLFAAARNPARTGPGESQSVS